jgi:hypothetical protein
MAGQRFAVVWLALARPIMPELAGSHSPSEASMLTFWFFPRFALLVLTVLVLLCAAPDSSLAQDLPPVRIIFMHHSTGQGLLDGGDLRETLSAMGYELWDHGYNDEGLTDASGTRLGINWDVPYDNTDPWGWAEIFQQPVTNPPANTFSHMLDFDVIVFKSCFPVSDIQSEEQLDVYRSYFSTIRDVAARHPDKLFIAFTPPPLVPNATTPEAAARARRWADDLASPEYAIPDSNMVVFDFFSQLADENGYLRAEYRVDENDSHPNDVANRVVAAELADFVDQAIRNFVADRPMIAAPQPEEPTPQTLTVTPVAGGQALLWSLDFEDPQFATTPWVYTNDGTLTFDCGQDSAGYQGARALQLTYELSPGGNAGCGIDVNAEPSWSQARAIRFAWRASQPGMVVRVALGVRDVGTPDAETTPFQVELVAQSDDWTAVTVPLETLGKPEWFSGGPELLNPADVIWIDFDVGKWDEAQSGTVWFDQVELLGE